MIKTPPGNKYWISPDGESVNGPYTLAQIANMHKFSPMSPETPMQAEGAEAWSTLAEWLPETRQTAKPEAGGSAGTAGKGGATGTINLRKVVIGLVLLAAVLLAAVYVLFVL